MIQGSLRHETASHLLMHSPRPPHTQKIKLFIVHITEKKKVELHVQRGQRVSSFIRAGAKLGLWSHFRLGSGRRGDATGYDTE